MSCLIPHENTDIIRFMVHGKQVEEGKLKWKNREAKRVRFYDVGISKRKI